MRNGRDLLYCKVKWRSVNTMSIIRDLKLDENGWFAEGKFDSKSLFQGEMKISKPSL